MPHILYCVLLALNPDELPIFAQILEKPILTCSDCPTCKNASGSPVDAAIAPPHDDSNAAPDVAHSSAGSDLGGMLARRDSGLPEYREAPFCRPRPPLLFRFTRCRSFRAADAAGVPAVRRPRHPALRSLRCAGVVARP
jgi:hypothetical protein